MVIDVVLIALLSAIALMLFTISAFQKRPTNRINYPRRDFNKAEVKGKKAIYLMGSLKNRDVIDIAKTIRKLGFEVFDDWIAPGPEADDFWREYEKRRGSNYKEALNHWAGKHIFEFDKTHIDRSSIGVLVMPAGKSAHMELGYMIGQNKKCFVLFDKEPERWDVMYQFADDIFFNLKDLIRELEKLR